MNYLQLKIVDTINYQQLKGQLLWLKSMDSKKIESIRKQGIIGELPGKKMGYQ